MAYSLTDVLTDLSYLLGEQSVPTTGIDSRKAFIQRTLEEIHRYADWEWAKATATTQLTVGVATLATTVQPSPNLDVRLIQSGTGSDHVFTAVPYEQQDNYGAGDYRYWLTGDLGALHLNTSEVSDSASVLTYRFDTLPSDLINGGTTKFPSSLVLAQGALRYHRMSEDPEYDVSQDQAIFQKGLDDLLADQQRAKPLVKAATAQDRANYYTGEI